MSALIATLFLVGAFQQAQAQPPPPVQRPSPSRRLRGVGPAGSGPQIVAMFNQVVPNWRVRCDDPNFVRQRVQFDLTLDAEGRIVSGPTPVNPQDDPHWQAAAAGAREALTATAPFDVPTGFRGGFYRPTFNAERACRNRQASPDEP